MPVTERPAMRGVAFIVAVSVVAEVRDFHRFENPRQLMAYLGLTLSEHFRSSDLIRHAENWLRRAASLGKPGRYQTEAAIQSYHVQLSQSLYLPGEALLGLYDSLVAKTPSRGAAIARAAAYARSGRPEAALAQLDTLPFGLIENHQPFWVARAAVLVALGHKFEAVAAYDTAIDKTPQSTLRAYLLDKRTMILQIWFQ